MKRELTKTEATLILIPAMFFMFVIWFLTIGIIMIASIFNKKARLALWNLMRGKSVTEGMD